MGGSKAGPKARAKARAQNKSASTKATPAGKKRQRRNSKARKSQLGALQRIAKTGTITDKRAALLSFWDAATHKGVPIPLRTTFGNYALHTFTDRFNFQASTTHDTILWIPWVSSPVSIMSFRVNAGDVPIRQRVFSQLQSTLSGASATCPVAMRPFRSSWRIANTTKQMSVDSNIFVCSYDSAIPMHVNFSGTASGAVSILDAQTTRLRSFIQQDANTRVYTGREITKEHMFASLPCHWPEYNAYHDFIPLAGSVASWSGNDTGAGEAWNMQSQDFYNLSLRSDNGTQLTVGDNPSYDEYSTYPYSTPTNVMVNSGPLVGIPCMRGHFVLIPRNTQDAAALNSDSESYIFERHLQVGCRFRPNSLGSASHMTPTPGNIAHEDTLLKSVMHLSSNPAAGIHSAVADAHNVVSSVVSGAAQAGEAFNSLKGLAEVLGAM